jgi:hypothetical protein
MNSKAEPESAYGRIETGQQRTGHYKRASKSAWEEPRLLATWISGIRDNDGSHRKAFAIVATVAGTFFRHHTDQLPSG